MQTTIMQTRRIHLVFLVMIFYNSAISQTISKQVLGASGKTLSNSNLKVSYTAGELVVGLMTAGGNQLGNGYYPAMDIQALNIDDTTLNVEIKVYPNPTSQSLYVTHPEYNSFLIQITDINGKQIYVGTIEKEMPLDVSSYSPGLYLFIIQNKESNKKNTYKIIKK
jgi:hypothetical protein